MFDNTDLDLHFTLLYPSQGINMDIFACHFDIKKLEAQH